MILTERDHIGSLLPIIFTTPMQINLKKLFDNCIGDDHESTYMKLHQIYEVMKKQLEYQADGDK